MALEVAGGSQTATLNTDHTLVTYAPTSPENLLLRVDANALANGETLILTISTRARAGGTTRVLERLVYAHAQDRPILDSLPFVGVEQVVCVLRQEGGTGRAFPWALIRLN